MINMTWYPRWILDQRELLLENIWENLDKVGSSVDSNTQMLVLSFDNILSDKYTIIM